MAARTRGEIKTLVESHTGRTKDALENSLCDTALKVALEKHPFADAQSSPADFTITEDTYSVDISATTDIINILTARIVEASGSRNRIFTLKPRTWWDLNVKNAEDNLKGWPLFGMWWGTNILLDRPADSGLELRLRITTKQSFASDSTVCPIALLDIFVEHYVTAGVFAELENWQSAERWKRSAFGVQYEINGRIGGELASAIESDSLNNTALEIKSEPYDMPSSLGTLDGFGLSVTNQITGHSDFGNTRWWH
ncbi:MAG: hypothetical protein ACXABY_13915 [Candidatus Thorarchaeota archaeon]|jgi:hypothetical protein